MISPLLNYSFVVVGTELCFVVLLVKFLLEGFLMPRWFGSVFTKMSLVDQHSLTNHVVALFIKGLCIATGVYPLVEVFLRPHSRGLDSYTNGHDPGRVHVTFGDLFAWCYLTVPTMYLFEIIYRMRISPVSLIHHIASISITTIGLTLILATNQEGNIAVNEFRLILIYGIFEMMFEVFPHIAMILYRIYRSRSHFLFLVFRTASFMIFAGTCTEQIAVGIFYFHIWKIWPVALKVEGIILHFCFMAAQIHGGRLCWQIARKMQSEAREVGEKHGAGAVAGDEVAKSENGSSTCAGTIDLERGLETPWTSSTPSIPLDHTSEEPKLAESV